LRSDEETDYTEWNEVLAFKLFNQEAPYNLFTDYTIKQGVKYKYAIIQYNNYGLQSNKIESNIVSSDFDCIFLSDGERQLRIKYNPFAIAHVNSNISLLDVFKYSKALRIFLNNNTDYKEFMNVNTTRHEYFFSSFKNYLTVNTSTPFIPYYATLCYLFSRIGETIGDFEYNHLKNSNLQKVMKQKDKQVIKNNSKKKNKE
jgi:hypothetical protein